MKQNIAIYNIKDSVIIIIVISDKFSLNVLFAHAFIWYFNIKKTIILVE